MIDISKIKDAEELSKINTYSSNINNKETYFVSKKESEDNIMTGDLENAKIIENTNEEKKKYTDDTYGDFNIYISKRDIEQLLKGKCIAGNINYSEYSIFIQVT